MDNTSSNHNCKISLLLSLVTASIVAISQFLGISKDSNDYKDRQRIEQLEERVRVLKIESERAKQVAR